MKLEFAGRGCSWFMLAALLGAVARAEGPSQWTAGDVHVPAGQVAEIFVWLPSGAVLRAEAAAPGQVGGVWLDASLAPLDEVSVMAAAWTVEFLAPPPTAAAMWCRATGPLDLNLLTGVVWGAGTSSSVAAPGGVRRTEGARDAATDAAGVTRGRASGGDSAVSPGESVRAGARMLEPSAPRTIYVHSDLGCDAWDGRALWRTEGVCGPKRTIRAAIEAARDGDRIAVLGRGCLKETIWTLNGKRLRLVALTPVRIEPRETRP